MGTSSIRALSNPGGRFDLQQASCANGFWPIAVTEASRLPTESAQPSPSSGRAVPSSSLLGLKGLGKWLASGLGSLAQGGPERSTLTFSSCPQDTRFVFQNLGLEAGGGKSLDVQCEVGVVPCQAQAPLRHADLFVLPSCFGWRSQF